VKEKKLWRKPREKALPAPVKEPAAWKINKSPDLSLFEPLLFSTGRSAFSPKYFLGTFFGLLQSKEIKIKKGGSGHEDFYRSCPFIFVLGYPGAGHRHG
jgi:hypothetical protein